MQIDERQEEYADVRRRPALTKSDCVRIAAAYKKRVAAGTVKKPMSLFIARILNAAVDTDR